MLRRDVHVWERLALHGHGWEGCTGDTRVLALSLSILSLRVVCDCVFFARHVCVVRPNLMMC